MADEKKGSDKNRTANDSGLQQKSGSSQSDGDSSEAGTGHVPSRLRPSGEGSSESTSDE